MGTETGAQGSTPTSAGNSDANQELEKLKQQNAELERAVKGIKADLLSEREKRQQAEAAKANSSSQTGASSGADPVDALLRQKVYEHAAPLIAQAVDYEKAKTYVANQLKVDPDEVEQSDGFKELDAFAKRRGIQGTPSKVAKIAWTLMQQEKKAEADAKAVAEAERLKAISTNGSVSSGTSAASSGSSKQLTNKEIESMSLAEYSKVRELIAKGEVKVVG